MHLKMADRPVVALKRLQWAWSQGADMAIWGSWPTGKPGGTIGSHQKGVISRESKSIAMKSRVMGDCQARFRERLEVQFLRPTRQLEIRTNRQLVRARLGCLGLRRGS